MPIYQFAGQKVNISRVGVLLDTNVLVAAFSERERRRHESARLFVEYYRDPFYIPLSVVVETWGMLVGSKGDWRAGLDFLSWINTPGKAKPLPETTKELDQIYEIVARKPHIDVVDALLLKLANDISVSCSLNPPLKIATFDTGDFLRFKNELKFDVFDLENLERY